jgi:hypothetical protein
MKTMILAVVAALSLGVGAAYAAGGAPAGYQEPVYGSQVSADQHNEASLHFLGKGTVLGKMFNYSSGDDVTPAATSTKGG